MEKYHTVSICSVAVSLPSHCINDPELTPAQLGLLVRLHTHGHEAMAWAAAHYGEQEAINLADGLYQLGLVIPAREPFAPDDREGIEHYVYLIEARDGLIKIGYTKDLTKRLAAIKASSPGARLLCHGRTHTKKNARWVEQFMHGCLDRHRVSGEWFTLPAAGLAWAISVLTGDTALVIPLIRYGESPYWPK